MSAIRGFFKHVGLHSLYHASLDIKLLCLQRWVRLFAYGSSTLILVPYLREVGISETYVGLFMSLTLVGDIAISFVLALFADGIGRKWILLLGAVLMIVSGVVFALSGNYWVLLAAAVFGVISPSGNEIGPFRAIEESTIAHLTAPEERPDIYAWYTLVGNSGAACGTLVCGWVLESASRRLKWDAVDIYRLTFYGYSAFGLVKALLTLMLSPAVEAPAPQKARPTSEEQAPLLQPESTPDVHEDRALVPKLSKRGMQVLISLVILFGLDSFASGLIPLSWLMYFFKSRYELDTGDLGTIFFITGIIASCSILVASQLAKRLGNVLTMVFTHIPSAILLALIPVPNQLQWSLVFLVLRSCIQSMDVAPRSAFLAAILQPEERTMSMGLINAVKTSCQSIGPTVTGGLAGHGLFWVSFMCAGSLKVCYDLGLLALFRNYQRVDPPRDTGEGQPEGEDDGRQEGVR